MEMLSLGGKNDLTSLCRICLGHPDEKELLDMNLIYDEDEQINYFVCFEICTNIKMKEEIGFPKNLCKSCGVELQLVYDFHKKIQESQRLLNEWLEERNTSSHTSSNEECTTLRTINIKDEEIIHIEALPKIEAETNPEILEEIDYNFNNGFEVINDDIPLEIEKSNNLEEEHLDFEIFHPSEIIINEDNKDNCDEKNSSDSDDTLVDLSVKLDWEDSNTEENMNYSNDDSIEKKECIEKNSTRRKISLKNNENGDGPPFLCEVCGHSSPSKVLLASHRHRKHRKTPFNFTCQKCGKGFDTRKRMENHLLRPTCETYPEFTCEYCSKICIGVANYNVHMRFHKKQYPYHCNFCDKKFMMATHLKDHVKTKHENQRYMCDFPECCKLFQTKHAMNTHRNTHASILPFKCKYCERMFPSKSRLRFHIKRSHSKVVTSDEIEAMRFSGNEKTIELEVEPLFEALEEDNLP